MRKFRLTPLISVLVAYILGILLGNLFAPVKYFWFLIIFSFFFLPGAIFYFVFQRNRGSIALLFFAFLSLGIARHLKTHLLPPNEISRCILSQNQKKVHLIGIVASIPNKLPGRVDFVLSGEELSADGRRIGVTGRTQVFIHTSEPVEINYGDRLKVSGRLSRPPASPNPGVFDYRKYLGHGNIHSIFSVYGEHDVKILGRAKIGVLRLAIARIRERMDSIITSTLPQLESSVLAGVMLGARRTLPGEIQEIFVDAGVVHTLAVSGLHVGLVLFIFYAFFRGVGIPKRTTYFLAIIVVLLYAQVTGGRPSAIRAAIMATCGLAAILLDRDKHLYNSLALAALIIMLVNPFTLFDVGFQLSFMATLGILYLTPYFLSYFHFSKPRKFLTYALNSLAVSAGASAGVYPIIAFYFNKISLIALIANILVVPQVGLVIGVGFAASILGLFSPGLAQTINIINRLAIAILIKCIAFFASLPFSSKYVVTPSSIFLLSYYLFFALLPRIEYSRVARRFFLFLPFIFLLSSSVKRLLPSDKLFITFLDVGRGDAIHLRLPDRRNILIDGGGGMRKWDIGERVIIPYLLKNGVSSLDAVFLTHPHYNHIGGLLPILKEFKVKKVYYSGQHYDDGLLEEFFRVIKKKRIPLKYMGHGDRIEYNGVTFDVLNPRIMKENIDSNSLVVKVNYGNFGMLFTGDIGSDIQDELSTEKIESDILQIPNHGRTPLSPKFLYKVVPEYGIISSRFGAKTLEEKYKDIRFFSTSGDGAILVESDGKSFQIVSVGGEGH